VLKEERVEVLRIIIKEVNNEDSRCGAGNRKRGFRILAE
jgi:hypothetical protein